MDKEVIYIGIEVLFSHNKEYLEDVKLMKVAKHKKTNTTWSYLYIKSKNDKLRNSKMVIVRKDVGPNLNHKIN